jgi:diguanylate cyclase
LQNQIARRAIVFDDQPIRLTASVGLAAYHRAFSNCDALLRAADAALYAAKAAGKNCLVVATSAPAPPAAVS